MLNATDRHVRNLIARGQLANHGTPRRIRVSFAEICEAIDSGRIAIL